MSMSTAEPSSNRGVAVATGEADSSARARARAVLAPGQRVRTAPEYQARWAGMHGVVRWVANGDVRVDLDGGESVTCGPRELVAGLTVEQQGVLAWLGETTNGRRILDDIASKVSRDRGSEATKDRVAATLACWSDEERAAAREALGAGGLQAEIAALCAEYAAADNKLQREWSAAAGQLGYSKRSWQDRSNALQERYRELLDALGYKGPLLPGGRRAEVCGLPVFDADGRQIGDAVLAGVTVTARVTDEHAAAVLRASANLRGSVGYRDPAQVAAAAARDDAKAMTAEQVAARADQPDFIAALDASALDPDELNHIAVLTLADLGHTPAQIAAGLGIHHRDVEKIIRDVSRDRLREITSGVYGPNRQEGKAMAAEPLLSRNAIRSTCEHRFCDAAGSRVYLYCQRGCGTRDPLESATPATADERGR